MIAADALIHKIDERSHQLLENPKMGLAREDVTKGMRHLVVGNYLVLCRVVAHGIEVVRVLHGVQDLGAFLP